MWSHGSGAAGERAFAWPQLHITVFRLQRRQPPHDVLMLIENAVQLHRASCWSARSERFSFHLHIDLNIPLGGGEIDMTKPTSDHG